MKRIVISLMIAGLSTMFTFGQKMETRSVSNITGIDASGSFEITVVKGSAESLTVETNDEIMPFVRSEVRNGVLRLYLERNYSRRFRNGKIRATVVMVNLDKISISGACKIISNDRFTSKSFTGSFSGSANAIVNVYTEQLNINLSGSSKVELIGSAKNATLRTSGSSKFNAENFTVGTANIRSSGSSNVTITATEALSVNSSGSSRVNYKGSPTIITINNSGSSRVGNMR